MESTMERVIVTRQLFVFDAMKKKITSAETRHEIPHTEVTSWHFNAAVTFFLHVCLVRNLYMAIAKWSPVQYMMEKDVLVIKMPQDYFCYLSGTILMKLNNGLFAVIFNV